MMEYKDEKDKMVIDMNWIYKFMVHNFQPLATKSKALLAKRVAEWSFSLSDIKTI